MFAVWLLEMLWMQMRRMYSRMNAKYTSKGFPTLKSNTTTNGHDSSDDYELTSTNEYSLRVEIKFSF